MQLEHEFVVPLPVDDAWRVLLDVERVAACVPGATLEPAEGAAVVAGKLTVKLGPITVTYRGEARIADTDATARSLRLEATGNESRGSGAAQATVQVRLEDAGPGTTRVALATDLTVTGRAANLSEGVMSEAGSRMLARFTACLTEGLPAPAPAEPITPAEPAVPVEPVAAAEPSTADEQVPTPAYGLVPSRLPERVTTFRAGGVPVIRRVVPAVGGLALLVVVWRWFRRR